LETVPTSTGANTVSPATSAVVGLTINGTNTGTPATAVSILQGYAASDLTLSNTGATSGNLVSLTQTTSAYTGTAILLNLASGSGSFTGNFLDLQKNSTSEFKVDNGGNVTAAGTITIQGTGTALTLSGAATTAINITNTGVTTDLNLHNGDTISNTAAGTLTLSSSTLTANSLATFNTAAALTVGNATSLTFSAGSETINGSTAANGDLTLQGTTSATRATSYLILQPSGGNVGIGTSTPTALLGLNGNAAAAIHLERETTANTAGNALTVQAGGATSGATDKAGGTLNLESGVSTGNCTGYSGRNCCNRGGNGWWNRLYR
jgi:hypothetical protein